MTAAEAARLAAVACLLNVETRDVLTVSLVVAAAVDQGRHPREVARDLADAETWGVYDGAALRETKRSIRNVRALNAGVLFAVQPKRPQG